MAPGRQPEKYKRGPLPAPWTYPFHPRDRSYQVPTLCSRALAGDLAAPLRSSTPQTHYLFPTEKPGLRSDAGLRSRGELSPPQTKPSPMRLVPLILGGSTYIPFVKEEFVGENMRLWALDAVDDQRASPTVSTPALSLISSSSLPSFPVSSLLGRRGCFVGAEFVLDPHL